MVVNGLCTDNHAKNLGLSLIQATLFVFFTTATMARIVASQFWLAISNGFIGRATATPIAMLMGMRMLCVMV